MKQIGITAGIAQVQKRGYLERLLKSKATGCGSISTVFTSIVLLCVSSLIIIIIMMMMIIIIIMIIIITITTTTKIIIKA